nr:hypothetical protein CFP56_77517 [Quercus suber]
MYTFISEDCGRAETIDCCSRGEKERLAACYHASARSITTRPCLAQASRGPAIRALVQATFADLKPTTTTYQPRVRNQGATDQCLSGQRPGGRCAGRSLNSALSIMAEPGAMSLKNRGSLKRFHESQRTSIQWSDLQKDVDLWFQDGNCLVHFYEQNAPQQQGPSLRIHYADVEALESAHLLQRCSISEQSASHASSEVANVDDTPELLHPTHSESEQYELYLPAPSGLTREQSYHYNLATRNSFAVAASLPLIGEKLGIALSHTWDRLKEWSSGICLPSRIWSYCDEQNYLEFTEHPDHALACLTLAEHARMRDLWVDSFVHCVGQCQDLSQSPEYEAVSQKTKALILRAALEMDLRIERVLRALGSFLEEELGTEYLGLSKPARDHLDRFRSFLNTYYVEKLGYFPPQGNSVFNKRMWTKMHNSFHALYEYLVDTDSVTDLSSIRGMNGGICVMQNVLAFDQRHDYAPLLHPLPLLPAVSISKPALKRSESAQRSLRNFRLVRFDSTSEQQLQSSDQESLNSATNTLDPTLMEYPLIQEFQRFERQRLEEKLSIAEARKVRWLLIYGILQMLTSITRAPPEVRDVEASPYPLCVSLTGCPPWTDEQAKPADSLPSTKSSSLLTPSQRVSNEIEDRISIHPDCEADSAEDFFAAHPLSRQGSDLSLSTMSQPLRISTQLSKTASIRSSVNSSVSALHRSVVGSLSRRNSVRSSRRHSVASVELAPCSEDMDSDDTAPTTEEPSSALAQFDFGLQMVHEQVNDEPTLEAQHLPALLDSAPVSPTAQDLTRSASDASSSAVESQTTSSNRSSYLGDYDSPATEVSMSWTEGNVLNKYEPGKLQISTISHGDATPTTSPTKRVSFKEPGLSVGVYSPNSSSMSVGCYVPTGYAPTVYTPTGMFDTSRHKGRWPLTRELNSPTSDGQMIMKQVVEEALPARRSSWGLDRIEESVAAEAKEHLVEA